MTFLALRALLAKVPGIAWVIIMVACFLAAAGYGLYHHGETVGKVAVHRAAVRDSVTHQTATVDTATAKSDRVIAVARVAVRRSAHGRATVQAVLTDTAQHVPPAIVAQVQAQLASDSATIAVQGAAIDTLLAERDARVTLDTLLVHQAAIEPPPRGHVVPVAVALGVVAVVLTLLHFAR